MRFSHNVSEFACLFNAVLPVSSTTQIGPFEWGSSAVDDSAEVSYWLDSNRNRYVANPNASAAADQPLVPQDPNAAVVTAFGQMNATLSTVVSTA